jgi:hypothetical protein
VLGLAATRELRRVGSIARLRAAVLARVSRRVRSSAEERMGFLDTSIRGLGARMEGVVVLRRGTRSRWEDGKQRKR